MAETGSAAWAADINSRAVAQYAALAASVLILYEYLITFDAEVRFFWRKEVNCASVLFFLNRYLNLFYRMSVAGFMFPFTDHACLQYVYAIRTIDILCYVPWGGFSALRVFALTGGNYFLAVVVFLLSLGPVGINFANFHWFELRNHAGVPGACELIMSESAALSIRLTIISRVLLIAADLTVIAVTCFTTYTTAVMARAAFPQKQMSISSLVFQDGLKYFILMFTLNVLQLAFSTSSVFISPTDSRGSDITAFTEVLTAILVWRFMLNLQEVKMHTTEITGVSGILSDPVGFDRIVGSIGGSLVPSVFVLDTTMGPEASESRVGIRPLEDPER